MNSSLVTIAVAVYNTEKYLRDCMDSVVNQTYQNLEIICVNDCSTDKSLEILEEYAAKDTRIKIITNEKNSGLGVTRNVGMDAAHGEYILFIDSDDWLDLTACEKLVVKAKENDSDVVFYSAYRVDRNRKKKMINFCNVSYPLSLEDRKILIKKTTPSTWSKLWKLEFMIKKGIRFPDFRWAEDQKPYWMGCLLTEKIAFETECLYYYRTNETQSTLSGDERFIQIIDVYDDIEEYLRKENLYSLYKKEFLRQKFWHYDFAFFNIKVQFRDEFLRKARISPSDIFFLLTQHRPLKHGIFLVFMKLPFWRIIDNLRRGIYRSIKIVFIRLFHIFYIGSRD
jgi:glycosyltransferase involved in cell wall biosynthesis